MEFKDYYAVLGLERTVAQDEIKRAYRKLARKYHPDVSQEPEAEARFKEVAEAYEALKDVEKRAAYDDVANRYQHGQEFRPPPGWNSGFEFSGGDFDESVDFNRSDFFESLFGHPTAGARGRGQRAGSDHHAKVLIDLQDAYRGGRRGISLRVPRIDANGQATIEARHLEVNIPKGIRDGQHLRLAGQGGPGQGDGPAGDLYLEIAFAPHPVFRVDGRDVYLDLPVAPWEAALGTGVTVQTPDGSVQLTVPPGSSPGRKLRLKGRGLPGVPPGDLYAVLSIRLPPADTPTAQDAYRRMAEAFGDFHPRGTLEA
ncbi:DnaJ C-terminal domain-containing protein [uncultured Thiocystis sp.]|jgi:curved DNA-binding protein|uniref:DnaJ C-terminal domain-containing protein n=1 Tax=uncultured Thiocystis sp. TaxID=1202134 RepID=UPI0025ED187F|nr:DnaJ C-terminal domain-containing protein [uncultured Thiocystis sp.]